MTKVIYTDLTSWSLEVIQNWYNILNKAKWFQGEYLSILYPSDLAKASVKKFMSVFFPTRGHLDNQSLNQGQSWLTIAALQKELEGLHFIPF